MGAAEAQLVGARVDALRIDYRARATRAMLARLTRARADARRGGAIVTIAGESFAVDRGGKRGKPFALRNPTAEVFVSEHAAHVDITVPFLMACPLPEVVAHAGEIARGLADGGIEAAEVVELDLCADLAHVSFTEDDREAFLGRSRRLKGWRSDLERRHARSELTGLQIGDRRRLSLILYNKTAELLQKRDRERIELEHEAWRAKGWDGDGDVWRVEFRPRGRTLTEYALRNPDALADRIDGAWQAFTQKDVRLVQVGARTRRERCPVDPRWELVQQARFLRADAPTARRRRRGSCGATLRQATGTMISALARAGFPRNEAEPALRRMLLQIGAADELDTLTARFDVAWARHGGATDPRLQ